MKDIRHFKSVSDYHKFAQIPAPEHPLISLVNYSEVNYPEDANSLRWTQDYYTIGLKRNVPYKLFYGQQAYDFDEGIMTFISPNQTMSLENNPNVKTNEPTGWLLLIHPDFLWNTPLAKQIREYKFFDYAVNEALFLSKKEEQQMLELMMRLKAEYQSNIDNFSQKIVLTHIELLLSYAERFYARQFITRKISNHQILIQLEEVLANFCSPEKLSDEGIPSVKLVAEQVHLSPNYLSSMLKSLTGQSTQQHIQQKLIEIAKTQLAGSSMSISEIAFGLGFEHAASFTKLFKSKTKMTPVAFRNLHN